ncbi:unnamed protein product [Camellia sinensis]
MVQMRSVREKEEDEVIEERVTMIGVSMVEEAIVEVLLGGGDSRHGNGGGSLSVNCGREAEVEVGSGIGGNGEVLPQ